MFLIETAGGEANSSLAQTQRPLKAMQWHLLAPAMNLNKFSLQMLPVEIKLDTKLENLRACILSKFREPNCCSQRKTMHCEFPDSQEAMQGLLTGCHNILNCCLIAQIQQRCSILSAALWKFTETTHNVQSCHIRKRFHSLGPTQKRQLTKPQFFS